MEEFLLKVVVVGNMCVGKTSLLLRYCDDTFSEDHKTTIGVDFKMKDLDRDDCLAKMQLWDTAGMDRFRTIVSSFYRGADGLIVVYDVTDRSSFERVPSWLSEAKFHGAENCIALLVGNKTDKEVKRVISTQEGKAFADRLGLQFFETSARDKSNVAPAFEALANALLARKRSLGLVSRHDENIVDIRSSAVGDGASWCVGYGELCGLV